MTLGEKGVMTTFLKNSLAGGEPLKRVLINGAIFSFVVGFIGSLFNDSPLNIRLPVFVVAFALSLLWCAMLWRCADNSDLNIGWLIRLCIAMGVIGFMLILVLSILV